MVCLGVVSLTSDNSKVSYNSKKGWQVNKNDLVANVAEITGMTKVDANKAVDAVIEAVTKGLSKDGEVRLVGFGTWVVVKRKATEGRNPRTGAPIKIPASKQPKFRPGKLLKDAIN